MKREEIARRYRDIALRLSVMRGELDGLQRDVTTMPAPTPWGAVPDALVEAVNRVQDAEEELRDAASALDRGP